MEEAEILEMLPLWKKSFVDWSMSDFGFYVPKRWDDYKQEWAPSPDGMGFPVIWVDDDIRIFRWAFTLRDDGTLPVHTLWDINGKKTGKTTIAAAAANWFGFFHEENADVQLAANSKDQAGVRVFQQLKWSIEHNPFNFMMAEVQSERVMFYHTRNIARALPSEATTQAGGNPVFVQVDEPWGFTTAHHRQFLDELARSPTMKISFRFFTSYPPYDGDDGPMVDVMNSFFGKDGRPKKGCDPIPGLEDLPIYMKDGVAVYWNHDLSKYPWHTERYLSEQKNDPTISAASYARFYEVRMASREDTFMPMVEWDACVDDDLMPMDEGDRGIPIVMSVDCMGGKVYSDCMASTVRSYDPVTDRYPLRDHKIWDPRVINDPKFDFNLAAEEYVWKMHTRHKLLACGYDPYQFASSAKKLERMGVNMIEITQMNSRALADTQYRNKILGRKLRNYPQSKDLRAHVSRAVARELGDGNIRIDKRLGTGRIDGCVTDSMTCLIADQYKERFIWLARHPKPIKLAERKNPYYDAYWGGNNK